MNSKKKKKKVFILIFNIIFFKFYNSYDVLYPFLKKIQKLIHLDLL